MATITTRAGKGSALTHQEVDANFTGLNTELGQKEVASNKGIANGYASLDAAGKVPSAQLPSYVDDVVEVANFASLPGTGETGKIYVTIDTNKTYRWSGSSYIEISASPGSTDSLAEGSTNLYFTQARARASLSASGSLSYNSSTGVISFTDAVTSVAGRTGAVTLTSSDVGLGNVENKSSATIRGELTSSNVTTALGFTPYNATNPSGYITSSASISGNAATATALQTARTINGTSFNGSANIDATEWYHSNRDFPSGTLITTSIDYSGVSGDPFVLEIRGNSYGNLVPLDIQYQGYIYDNTIINHGGIANGLNITGLVALNVGGFLCFWFPSQGYWNGYNVRVYTAYATRAINRVTAITGTTKPSGTKEVALSSEIRQSLHSGNYGSYALPLSGGVLSGNTRIATKLSVGANTTDLTFGVAGASHLAGYVYLDMTGAIGASGSWSGRLYSTGGVTYINTNSLNVNRDGYGSGTLLAVDTSGASVNGNAVLTAANYSSYALPLSGGTITGDVGLGSGFSGFNNISGTERTLYIANSNVAALYLHSTSGSGRKYALFAGASGGLAIYDATAAAMRFVLDTSAANFSVALQQSGNQVLHAANYGSYALPLSGGTLTGSRPIQFDTGGGYIAVTANSGGWSMGTYYKGSGGTIRAGFGALGGGNDLTYAWIGTGHDGAWMTLTPSQITANADVQLLGNYLRFDQTNVRSWNMRATGGNLDLLSGDGSGAFRYNGGVILTANNVSSYALPIGGGNLTGQTTLTAGHNNTRFQLRYNHDGDPNSSSAGYLTLWASEPGISYAYTGIGANINVGGQYYGRQSTGQTYGLYIRFDTSSGQTQFWNTTATPGPIGGQGTMRAIVAADGEFYATSSTHKVLHAGNYNSYALPLSGGTLSGDLVLSTGANRTIQFGSASNYYWRIRAVGDDFRIIAGADTATAMAFQYSTWNVGIGTTSPSYKLHVVGDIYATSNVTAYSDERVKANWRHLDDGFVVKLAGVKSGIYDRVDIDLTQAGVSAQSLREVLPETVMESREGDLSVAYGNAALVSAVELAKELVALKQEVAELRARVH